MKILIDADGCPVVDECVALAYQHNIDCLILCDTSHQIERAHAVTKIITKGKDSVDFALIELIEDHDIIITQDYGLASMCLAFKVTVMNQDGLLYTTTNIDQLLMQRALAHKIRRSGGKTKGPAKRKAKQNETFKQALAQAIVQNLP